VRSLRIFDYALIHTAPISSTLLAKYASSGQTPIEADLDRIRSLGVEPIPGDFALEGSLLRHDPERVTEALLKLALSDRRGDGAQINANQAATTCV